MSESDAEGGGTGQDATPPPEDPGPRESLPLRTPIYETLEKGADTETLETRDVKDDD